MTYARFAWLAALALTVVACAARPAALASQTTTSGNAAIFGAAGDAATRVLEDVLYDPAGKWRRCLPDADCGEGNIDWGDDSLTYALAFRWRTTKDPNIPRVMTTLARTAFRYGPCPMPKCDQFSDRAAWDSVAESLEHEITGDDDVLAKAKAAFSLVDETNAFGLGACPGIDYQLPNGDGNHLKTLETDANYVLAAMLLYRDTGTGAYLKAAVAKYAAIRSAFLDPAVPLYSVYVFDDGTSCKALPHRFFASVNGDMIQDGLLLAAATKDQTYRDQAIATAKAVAQYLSDPAGVYADLQAENDTEEPLIEAMYALATEQHQNFARTWLLTAARAERSARTPAGVYGRFFDGPPPQAPVTEWQTGGGLALAIAAAALEPDGTPPLGAWSSATYVSDNLSALPATISIHGRAIALIGTIGESCCESGHARVFIDGTETFDHTGIWQNKSSSGKTLPQSVLFAWRWPAPGPHTIVLRPGVVNGKEGTSFLHITGYELVP
jgi:hypothetical protein